LGLGIIVALFAPVAAAHDFWILPVSFRPQTGVVLQVHLRVGMNLAGEPVQRDDARIARFVLLDAGGSFQPVVGLDGQEPAGMVRILGQGPQILAYESTPAPITLEAAKFDAYLADEGLDRIRAIRKERGQAGTPGREVFSRHAKALLRVGDETGSEDRLVGLTLEIAPVQSPRVGEPARFRVLFHGRALPGALVVSMSAADVAHPDRQRTDERGEVTLELKHEGLHLIKCVHMIEAPDSYDADWESFWGSLTFEAVALTPGR